MATKENSSCEWLILRAQNPLSESAILRNHALYQKSHLSPNVTPVPTIRTSPVRRSPIRRPKAKPQVEIKPRPEKKSSASTSPVRTRVRNSIEELEYRRVQRKDRERPWQDKPPKLKNKAGTIKLYYDKALPASVDKSKVTLRARKFVANTKYGNIYEIREQTSKSKGTKSPQPRKWIWEDEFLLWMKGSREKYMEELGSTRTKQKPTLRHIDTFTSSSTTPRPGSLPSIRENGRPNAEVYA